MSNRKKLLGTLLQEKKVDALFLADTLQIFALTGFRCSHGLLLIDGKGMTFFTDARYLQAAEQHACDWTVFDLQECTEGFFQKKNYVRVGVDFDFLTVHRQKKWKKLLGAKLVHASLEVLLSQKTASEIEAHQRACKLGDRALGEVLPLLKPGIREAEFAWQLEKTGRELGAEAISFEPIVAFGANGAIPHHHPGETKLQKNTPILIDWGFVVDGYCSDCTRCFFLGAPTESWRQTYETVLQAQETGKELMQTGTKIARIQSVAEKELGEKMIHSFGHGVGVRVHEYPGVSTKTKGEFLMNQIVTAEPGLYRSGEFGIRIEDTVVIQEEGGPKDLTKFPKDLERMIL